ncbi:unnamed protein product, partial [Meganyctiphanes norvegica]
MRAATTSSVYEQQLINTSSWGDKKFYGSASIEATHFYKWANTSIDVHCENGGYVDANGVCVCPPGTNGTLCEHINGSYYLSQIVSKVSNIKIIIRAPLPRPLPRPPRCKFIVLLNCFSNNFLFVPLYIYVSRISWNFLEFDHEKAMQNVVQFGFVNLDLDVISCFLNGNYTSIVSFHIHTLSPGCQNDLLYILESNCIDAISSSNLIH